MARTEQHLVLDAVTGQAQAFARSGAGAWRAVADSADDAPVTVLAPADRCSYAAVELPEMSAARMHQALRWAAEDAIAGDPEAQQVVATGRESDGRMGCLIAARAELDKWRAGAPRPPERIVPDAACVPWQPGRISLLPVNEQVLVRYGATDFDRMEPDLLPTLIPDLIAGMASQPRLVWLGERVPEALGGLPVEVEPVDSSWLVLLGSEALGETGRRCNLARGDYAPDGSNPAAGGWRRLALAAGLAVTLLLADALVELAVLDRQNKQTEDLLRERAQQLFPELGPLVRPRAQLERALASRQSGAADRFMRLISAVNPLLSGVDAVQVASLRFRADDLALTLTAPGMPDLEALQVQLRARGLSVRIGEVTVEPGQVRAELRVGLAEA